jgi:hypothetical protein
MLEKTEGAIQNDNPEIQVALYKKDRGRGKTQHEILERRVTRILTKESAINLGVSEG